MANFFTKYLPIINFRKKTPTNLMPATGINGMPQSNFFSGYSKSGEVVNERSVNQLATYYACIRNICEDISKLPYVVIKTESNGNKTRITKNNAYQLLNKKPNGYAIPFDIKYSILKDAIGRGNGYGYIVRNSGGFVEEIHYVDSNFVYPQYDTDTKNLWYTINYEPLKLAGIYSSEEVFHIKGAGNTMVGQSVLGFQLQSLGKALAIQDYSSNYFKEGAAMSGLLTFEGVNDEKKLQTYINMFLNSFSKGGIGGGPSGMKFEQMNYDPQKSQFIETENLIRGEIARWFRMPLSKLSDLSDTNNSSLEQTDIKYLTDTLMPWIVRFEQEADKKLFAINERETLDGYFDTQVYYRGDSAAMERKTRTMFTSGGITPNEVRKMWGENTIDNEASNINYVPSNMIPANEAIEFWKGQAEKNLQLTQSEPIGGQQQ